MGWCTGSHLCEDIWILVRDYIPEENRVEILANMIDRFADEDADCWGEVMTDLPEYREALKMIDLYDSYFEDNEDDENN